MYTGPILLNRLKEAEKESVKQREAAVELERAFPKEVAAEIRNDIAKWNEDPDNSKDPYYDSTEGMFVNNIKDKF